MISRQVETRAEHKNSLARRVWGDIGIDASTADQAKSFLVPGSFIYHMQDFLREAQPTTMRYSSGIRIFSRGITNFAALGLETGRIGIYLLIYLDIVRAYQMLAS